MDTLPRDQPAGISTLIRIATVRIGDAENGGTGFFVAPRKILTCAHVIEDLENASLPLTVTAIDGSTGIASLEKSWREEELDLALLNCAQLDLPSLLLQPDYALGASVSAYGYPRGEYRIGGDSAYLVVEGPYGELGDHIRLKDSSIGLGFSGAPIVSPDTAGVIGMITKTRDVEHPHGARAIAGSAIIRVCSNLIDLPSKPVRNTSLSPFSSIPYQHIECVGRTETIDEMTRELVSGRTCLLFGMPGIGKSLVAAKVVESTQQSVQGSKALWIDVESVANPSQMVDHIAGILHLGIPFGMSLPDRERYVRQALSDTSNLIIVLDGIRNNDVAANTISRCIPGSVRIIATSQRKLAIFKTRRRLDSLTPSAAYELFISQLDSSLIAADQALVEEICAKVGYHPLAVRLLGSKVDSEQLPLATLRDRLDDEISTWEIAQSADRAESATLHASIAAAISALDEDSFRLLIQVAFLPRLVSADIALKAFAQLSEASGQDLLGELVSRSLLLRDGELIRQNVLIRGYCQAAAGEGHPKYHRASVKAVSTHLLETPPIEISGALVRGLAEYVISEPWPSGALDSPSQLIQDLALLTLVDDFSPLARGGNIALQERAASSLLAKSTQLGGEFEFAAQLAVASFYSRNGHVDKALSILQSLQKNRAGTESADLASVLISLGNTAMVAGAREYACQSLVSARRIAQSLSSEVLIASSSGQLGKLSLQLGLQTPAIALYRRALGLYEQLRSREGVSAASFFLGTIANQIGDHNKARAQLEVSLSIDESLGDVAGQLTILHELGKLPEIDREFLDSKFATLRDRLLDEQNPEGLSRTYLAWADTLLQGCKNQNELKDLIPLYEKAKESGQQATDHLSVARAKGQLGLAWYWMNDLDLGARYSHESLESYRKAQSEQGYGLGLVQLAAIRIAQEREKEAIGLLETSIQFLSRHPSPILNSAGALLHQLLRTETPDVSFLAAPWSAAHSESKSLEPEDVPSQSCITGYLGSSPRLEHLPLALHYLAPASVPVEGLVAALQQITNTPTHTVIEEALTHLVELRIVDRDESGRFVTSNVPDSIARQAKTQSQNEGLKLATEILGLLHPLQDIPNRYKLSNLDAHKLSLRLTALSEWRSLVSSTHSSLLNNAALTFMDTGQIAAAFLCLDAAVANRMNLPDENGSEPITDLLNNYATVVNRLELYEMAEDLFKDVIERVIQADPTTENGVIQIDLATGDSVGKSISNFGHLLLDTGRLDEAWANFRTALLIHERVNGLIHPTIAVDLSNLGLVKSLRLEAASAIILYERSLRVWTACDMADTRHAAEVMIQISGPLYGLGRHTESEQMLAKAIDILRQADTPTSLPLIRAYQNLGIYYRNMGEQELAVEHLLHGLAISDMFYGSRSALSRNLRQDIEHINAL